MKKIIITTLTVIVSALGAQSQIILKDSANNTDIGLYTGFLGGSGVLVTDGSITNFCTFRIGGTVNWKPKQWFSLYALGAGEINQTGKLNPFGLFGATFLHKQTKLVVGKIATPLTELRPLPTTGPGQFEPWTRQQILGSALGVKISFTSKKFHGVGGIFKRGSDYSLEAGVKVSQVHTAGYYMSQSKEFGIASNVVLKNFTTTVFANSKNIVGMLDIITIPRLKISLYSDIGYDFRNKDLLRGEWGVIKSFKVKPVNALLAVGYDQKARTIKNYIFVYL